MTETNPKVKISSEKSQLVNEWLDLEIQMNKLKTQMKELKKKQETNSSQITEWMETLDLNEVETKKGVIKMRNRSTKRGLKETSIKESLQKIFKDSSKVNEITSQIMNNREHINKVVLSTGSLKN